MTATAGTAPRTTAAHARIVFVTDNLGVGGAERHLVRLISGLAATSEWEVTVYCLSRSGEFVSSLEERGIPVVGSPEPWSRSPGRLLRATVDLYRYFRQIRPDIAHCYMVYGGFLGSVTARLAGVPYVVTTRRIAHGYTGRRLLAYRLVHALMDRLSDAVIAVCETARLQAVAEGTPVTKTFTVYNAIDLPEPEGIPQLSGSPVIGTICSLAKRKGLSYLLAAVPRVLQTLPEARFFLVGDGPQRQNLELQALDLGISTQVEFLGPRGDIAGLLCAFDLFVLPSLLEGMPNAVLEAMAAGVPVVATAVGGVPEFVESGHTGLLVPPASPSALADAMLRLATDVNLRRQCAHKAQVLVDTRFTAGRELGDTEQVYRWVLGRPVSRLFAWRGSRTA